MSRAVDEAARQLAGEVEVLSAENERLRAALDAPPYVDCICPGCPRKVPQAWVSGLCEPCAAEDCEHTDGAKAVAADRDGLLAALRPLLSDIEDAAETDARWEAVLDVITGMTRDDLEAAEVKATDAACHAHGMGQEDGVADERAAIVGFLRRWFERPAYAGAHAWMLAGTREALAAIERGEHRAAAGSSTATSSPPVSCRCFHAPEQHDDNKLAAGWGRCAEDGCDCPGWRP